jgi:ATP-dependent Lon protease
MALGGMRDEAEIRGHRRTYIGSMPGKVLQSLSKVGVRNPLFLLDEIDKLGMDFRGDPSSALLEVLDPEQNHTFSDHYVEVDFDLSDVMFVATSNSMNIPPALLDRMEVIRLAGYTEDEKLNIAQRYLLPKQQKNNGVKDGEMDVTESAMRGIMRYYTREAGVRSLEREIGKICRKVVKGIQLKKYDGKVVVTDDNLNDFLGVRKFDFGRAEKKNQVGQVVGLAWTEVGGDLLTIEAAVMPGKGNIIRTGSLGDVMKESVEAARSVVRSVPAAWASRTRCSRSATSTSTCPTAPRPRTARVRARDDHGLRVGADRHSGAADVAMTGEITLRGEVTAIGGLKEKLLAAHRGGVKTVLIPEENVKDLQDIPGEREEPPRDRAGALDRPGAGDCAGAGARGAARRRGSWPRTPRPRPRRCTPRRPGRRLAALRPGACKAASSCHRMRGSTRSVMATNRPWCSRL